MAEKFSIVYIYHIFFIHVSAVGYPHRLYSWATVNSSKQECESVSVILPWSSRAAAQGKSLLRFLRNTHIGFHRGWVSLHSSMASLEFLFSLPIWWGNLNVVLIWTPLMPTDVENLSNDYWPSALYPWRTLCSLHYHIYWSFDVFVIQFFSPLHSLDINPLSDAELAKICSYPSVFIVPFWTASCYVVQADLKLAMILLSLLPGITSVHHHT